MRRLANENAPCWYELSWDSAKCSLVVRIHEKFLESVGKFCVNEETVQYVAQKYSFLKFSRELIGNIGFEDALLWRGKVGEFVEWVIPIPCIRTLLNRKCSNCQGSGQDDSGRGVCPACHGLGKDHVINNGRLSSIVATLEVLFSWLEIFRIDTGSSRLQLMTINTVFDPGQYNGLAIGGDFSPAMSQWLGRIETNQPLTVAIEAMRQVDEVMCGVSRGFSSNFHFQAMSQQRFGGFYLQCPGNSCVIHHEGLSKKFSDGDIFTCHNVDSSVQQITLLVGLAALHDQARRELSINK
jgi:hypothetical protein